MLATLLTLSLLCAALYLARAAVSAPVQCLACERMTVDDAVLCERCAVEVECDVDVQEAA